MKKTTAATGLIVAALVTLSAMALRAQHTPSDGAVPLKTAVVGTWRGDSFFDNSSTNFGHTSLELRFTDYGIVTARRGPMKNRPVVDSWTGDYIVVGSAIYISPHGGNDDRVLLSSLAVVDGKLEGLAGATGNYGLGVAFSVARQ